MRRSISKIPRIAAAAASFSTAGGRRRGFLVKVEDEAKFASPLTSEILEMRQIISQLTKSGFFEKRRIISQLRKSVYGTRPTSQKEVLERLREVLEKLHKPSFMKKRRRERWIKSEEEWKETMEATLNALSIMKETEEITKMAKRVSSKMIEAKKQGQTLGAETLADETIEVLSQGNSVWLFDEKREFIDEFTNMHIWCTLYISHQLLKEPTNIVSKGTTSRKEVLELLREVLEKVNKPLFMSETRIKNEEEWEETIEATFNALTIMKETEEITKMAKRSSIIYKANKQRRTDLGPETASALADETIKAFSQINSCWLFDKKREFKNELINMHIWCILYINQHFTMWPIELRNDIIQHVALCIHPWETGYKKDCLI